MVDDQCGLVPHAKKNEQNTVFAFGYNSNKNRKTKNMSESVFSPKILLFIEKVKREKKECELNQSGNEDVETMANIVIKVTTASHKRPKVNNHIEPSVYHKNEKFKAIFVVHRDSMCI